MNQIRDPGHWNHYRSVLDRLRLARKRVLSAFEDGEETVMIFKLECVGYNLPFAERFRH
ncbi:hypothetical protein HYDPIDRAFT_110360 [Hydnomerulius pinastri MD-312]|nr:hypothetical protein HYDPIDRAFT_110360 [Hydnomerulius pinastri MD-312]